MTLYFVRHGESEANLLHEFSNRGLKHGLTRQGRLQAQTLAQTLQSVRVGAIFSSPLLRARQTAEILAIALGTEYQITDALREFDCGLLEGKSDDASWDQYWQLVNAWLVHHDWEQKIDQGESFLDIQRRFVPFVEHLARADQATDRAVILVGHGGTYRCMLPLVLTNIDVPFVVEHGISHTSPIVAQATPAGLMCSHWGEIRVDPVT